jgi:DNA-binding transcriptional regulator YdaS (Cro superfamily)
MQLIEYLDGERGRAASLARAIGVRATQIGKWVSGERPIPEKRCVQIERATDGRVSRQELRDDWREIWPELSRDDQAGHAAPAVPAHAAGVPAPATG